MLLTLLLASCAASGPPTVEVGASDYERAFDAAREALRDYRFALDRVDANEGVLTTRPKATSGLATPWDREQTAFVDEIEDLAHAHQRRVRISFERAGHTPGDDPSPISGAPSLARVEVVVERVALVGWQPAGKAILHSGFTSDPLAAAAGRPARNEVPIARDDALAARIADRIRDRLKP